MRLKYLLFIALSALAPYCVHAAVPQCQSLFNNYVKLKADQGVPEKHLPQLMLATAASLSSTVVLIHGMFESPYFVRGIAHRFNDAGYNVISTLLPGQWEADATIADEVNFQDWIKDLDQVVSIARCVGPKVIFAGYSLGGTLAMVGALRYPDLAAGLALWAPALELRILPSLAGVLGSILGMDGNVFTKRKVDRDEVTTYAPNAAIQIYDLNRWVGKTYGDHLPVIEELGSDKPTALSYSGVYAKIAVPTVIVIPEKDPAVSPEESKRLYEQLKSPKLLIGYAENAGVWHGNVVKSKDDTYKIAPHDFNPFFDQMAQDVISFFKPQ